MISLHEFITKIRNCKTAAEERAEYQKEMAAIRESFFKGEQHLRPRNVTKLLFINMSGQQTSFGQMECLSLISTDSLMQKRIGYLGLTQLFHEKSELLMMATNRMRVDLSSSNNNLVALVLCVLSEICTAQLSRELHNEVLKCIGSASTFIKKKALLCSVKIIRKTPEFASMFVNKISTLIEQKSNAVALASVAVLENVVALGDKNIAQVVELVPKIVKAYRWFVTAASTEHEVGGITDPFLQVAMLRLLHQLRKVDSSFDRQLTEVLSYAHEAACVRATTPMKNGASAVLLECFQCMMLLPPTPQITQMANDQLNKFISIKDANSKYLSLFNLSLMAKYDINVAKVYRKIITECLEENDSLIRSMALNLLFTIAMVDNASSIIKDLLNHLLQAIDEDFIDQLSATICLIVQKHSESRRWHFDTILRVLILAGHSIKEESTKSLVYLISSTPQLQQYCLAKLFFSTNENPDNNPLSRITLYLLGEFAQILLKVPSLKITETVVVNLIEKILFKLNADSDTVAYGLSCLFKLFDKFPSEKPRIEKIVKLFQSHSDMEVQKRACEYSQMITQVWDKDRREQICLQTPPLATAVQAFTSLPVGDVSVDLEGVDVRLPEKIEINYESHLKAQSESKRQIQGAQAASAVPVDTPAPQPTPAAPMKGLMDDDDDILGFKSTPATTVQPTPVAPAPKSGQTDFMGGLLGLDSAPAPVPVTAPVTGGYDPFGLLGNMGMSTPAPVAPANNNNMNLMGFSLNPTPAPVSQPSTANNNNLLFDGGLLGFSSAPSAPPANPAYQPAPAASQDAFSLLTGFSSPSTASSGITMSTPSLNDSHRFTAFQNEHFQLTMECSKEAPDRSRIIMGVTNLTGMPITDISCTVAVLKHLKIVISPISGSSCAPMAKNGVTQVMIERMVSTIMVNKSIEG